MNEESEIGSRLREQLRVAEPPLRVSVDEVRRVGRRKRHVRNAAVSVASMVSVVGIAIGSVAVGNALDDDTQTPAAADGTAYSPDELVSDLNGRVASLAASSTGTWKVESVVAEGAQAALLEGDARDRATRWQATYSGEAGHFLDIILIYEAEATEVSIESDCHSMLSQGWADRCEASRVSDSLALRYVERPAQRVTDGWPVIQEGDRAEYYLHQVVARHSDGFAVYVTEVGPVGESADGWIHSREQLERVATDPKLWFPDIS